MVSTRVQPLRGPYETKRETQTDRRTRRSRRGCLVSKEIKVWKNHQSSSTLLQESQGDLIHNGNRTDRVESNSVCNQTSDLQNRTTAKQESDLFITSMITDRIDDKKSCYQLIITISISEKTNTPRTNLSSADNVFSLIFLHFGNCLVFLWINGCCHGCCDQLCDRWI